MLPCCSKGRYRGVPLACSRCQRARGDRRERMSARSSMSRDDTAGNIHEAHRGEIPWRRGPPALATDSGGCCSPSPRYSGTAPCPHLAAAFPRSPPYFWDGVLDLSLRQLPARLDGLPAPPYWTRTFPGAGSTTGPFPGFFFAVAGAFGDAPSRRVFGSLLHAPCVALSVPPGSG